MPVIWTPRGSLTEADLRALEAELGTVLPGDYRAWLAATNGAGFPERAWIPEHEIFAEETLWGYRTARADTDLVEGRRRTRDVFTDDYTAITRTLSGYLAVKTGGEDRGSVWEFDIDRMREDGHYDPVAVCTRTLVRLADDFTGFLELWETDRSAESLGPPEHPGPEPGRAGADG
ncbi:SMI1/KNR4 family protein [Streptomyces nitrosporeus]|uniref:SMI1/KNR4 family protein n=1 Tax=Streptomyces nitrosporeus TaxID=28894 RepID=A0A5J6FI55_9ACTN|nr:SMI1/KNR4 family protein [Streptomyces nitrosporeus]QEU76012.1 SMI1/KNR4 family protein [Streptomyces nitrosporeus]GGZ23995.1 hypothetical protein GCM10010327_63520 [Streptomyces nitrosporeus]